MPDSTPTGRLAPWVYSELQIDAHPPVAQRQRIKPPVVIQPLKPVHRLFDIQRRGNGQDQLLSVNLRVVGLRDLGIDNNL